MKFNYELGEIIADCTGEQGIILERFARVVVRPPEDGRTGNRNVRVPGYKVAFPATEDGGASCIVLVEEDDLFPPTGLEEMMAQ